MWQKIGHKASGQVSKKCLFAEYKSPVVLIIWFVFITCFWHVKLFYWLMHARSFLLISILLICTNIIMHPHGKCKPPWIPCIVFILKCTFIGILWSLQAACSTFILLSKKRTLDFFFPFEHSWIWSDADQ